MPCFDPPDLRERINSNIIRSHIENEIKEKYDILLNIEITERLRIEAMLCAMFRELENQNLLKSFIDKVDPGVTGLMPLDLQLWWEKHKLNEN